MKRLDDILSDLLFGLLALVLLGAPWLFAAWEMWWFWLFVVLLFAATAVFGLRMILCSSLGTAHLRFTRPLRTALLASLPFLVYALIRFLQAEVFMDAEKSFLLFLTPWLLLLITLTVLPGRSLLVVPPAT